VRSRSGAMSTSPAIRRTTWVPAAWALTPPRQWSIRGVARMTCPTSFIGDGSVFVTSGAVNPALTISALATRTAEGIAAAFRGGQL